MKKFGLFGG